jgi:hypothetical protein
MTVIGPNFANEVAAAGLNGLPFTWNKDGVNLNDPNLTPEQIDAINVVIAAHDPTKPNPHTLFAEALSHGCQIELTGIPTLNATYDASGPAWQMMKDEVFYIITFGSFSGNMTELSWLAMDGSIVRFTTTEQFKSVAKVIGDWLTKWQQFITGQIPLPPTLPVIID